MFSCTYIQSKSQSSSLFLKTQQNHQLFCITHIFWITTVKNITKAKSVNPEKISFQLTMIKSSFTIGQHKGQSHQYIEGVY